MEAGAENVTVIVIKFNWISLNKAQAAKLKRIEGDD